MDDRHARQRKADLLNEFTRPSFTSPEALLTSETWNAARLSNILIASSN
jgi:hypothetical protein